MKNTAVLLEMLVSLSSKNDLIDEAINSLQSLKQNINDEDINNRTALSCIKVYLKVDQKDKPIQEVISRATEHSKISQTAIEFSQMVKDLNKE